MVQQDLVDSMMSTANGIVEDLEAYHDGKVMDRNDMRMKDEAEIENEDDVIDLYEYLMDNLGMRYIIDQDMDYDSCIITFAIGGPGIWLDTYQSEIRGRWGCDEVHVPLWHDIVEMVDDEVREYYECRRGC